MSLRRRGSLISELLQTRRMAALGRQPFKEKQKTPRGGHLTNSCSMRVFSASLRREILRVRREEHSADDGNS